MPTPAKLLAVLLAAVSLFGVTRTIDAAEKPNFVLILCDDMGFSDLGCTGSEIATPNIDRLAADGQMWTQFYNNAKCTTTRASLITGLYPRRSKSLLRPNMATLPEALTRGGYVSHMAGKWHLGSKSPHQPTDRGFSTFYGLLDGCCNFFDPSIPDPDFKGGRVRWFGQNLTGTTERITDFQSDYYTTDAFTDSAIAFVKQAAAGDSPFFLNLNYTAPHYPLHAPEDEIAKYRGRYSAGWDVLRAERFARQKTLGLFPGMAAPAPANRDTPDWNSLSQEEREYHAELMAVYAAMIDRMDQQIGRLIAALRETETLENTVVMFLSDNGGCAEKPGGIKLDRTPGVRQFYTACGPGWATAQNTPFRRYKQWVHEGGISTPFILRCPESLIADGVKRGRFVGEIGHIIDVQPTILELAGVTHPVEMGGREIIPLEGVSLAATIIGEASSSERTLFFEWSRSRAVREGDWKLVRDRGKPDWELYNVAEDRTEQHDLAKEQPSRVKRMEAAWLAWAEKTELKAKDLSRK